MARTNPFKRHVFTFVCLVFILLYAVLFSVAISKTSGNSRTFEQTQVQASLLPPSWWFYNEQQKNQVSELGDSWFSIFGTDQLGRDIFSRCVVGGAVSIAVGLFAACIAVFLGTAWGTVAAVKGGRVDSTMMRIVDILYGLPSIMLVVLITIAANALLLSKNVDSTIYSEFIQVVCMICAIGTVSWLTVSRVIRGQVKSLLARPTMEACKVMGLHPKRMFTHHLLPALLGTILVYATLTVPAAILSEAFLSFLGIGIREPIPSWGNLASDGLSQLNPVHSRWWLLFWPCLCISFTLVVMNWLGQLLRRHATRIASEPV